MCRYNCYYIYLGMEDDIIAEFLKKDGFADLLTVLPGKELEEKGIPYIRSKINEGGNKEIWDSFWRYIVKNYVKDGCKYPIEYWNVSHLSEKERSDIINKTNNPLERFNREYNEAMNTNRPSISHFVQTINALSNKKVTQMKAIAQKKESKPQHLPVKYVSIPRDYDKFVVN